MEEGKEKQTTNENIEPEKELNQEPNIEKDEIKEEVETKEKTNIEENTKETAMITIKTKKQAKQSYFAGIIGAILGGLVAALPWLLTYIFANNMVIPILASIIPLGTFLGYKIFRGKTKKIYPIIVTIISLIIVVLLIAIISPCILLLQSEYQINWENIVGLYSDVRAEIRDVLIQDLVAGIIFWLIGIIIVIKGFIIKPKTLEERILIQQEKQNKLREQSEIIKNACLDLNSISKESAVKKKLIIRQLIMVYHLKKKMAKLYFNNCKINKLLKKHKGKYFYNQNDEEENIAKVKKVKSKYISKKVILIITLIVIITGILAGDIIVKQIEESKKFKIEIAGVYVQPDETQDYYATPEVIAYNFGEEFAQYYDFIIFDKNGKYELYGLEIPATAYEGKDFSTIIQEDRDYYAPYIGEDIVGPIEDKQIGEHKLKSYKYAYTGTSGSDYKAVIYLYESETSYMWINVYTDSDIETSQVDKIIDNLLK